MLGAAPMEIWNMACQLYQHCLTKMSHNKWPEFTVYPKKYAHGFVVLCFVVVMQSFIMNSHEVFIHIHQGCFAGTGAIVRLTQCQWSKPDGYGKINQCITTTKHSKAKTVCIFLGIYCMWVVSDSVHFGDGSSSLFIQWTTVRPLIPNASATMMNMKLYIYVKC